MTTPATKNWAQRRPHYLNLFERRKTAIHLSGLFLFDPDVAMRIHGLSVRTTFIEMGQESLHKSLVRAGRLGRATQTLKNRLVTLFTGATGKAWAAAFDDPGPVTNSFAQMGAWEAHLLGAMCDENGTKTSWLLAPT